MRSELASSTAISSIAAWVWSSTEAIASSTVATASYAAMITETRGEPAPAISSRRLAAARLSRTLAIGEISGSSRPARVRRGSSRSARTAGVHSGAAISPARRTSGLRASRKN